MATSHLQELPEDTRLLVRSAVQRIHDIANDLAGKKVKTPGADDATPAKSEPSLELLSSIVDSNLGNGAKGEDVTWLMGKKGYGNLFLATGTNADQFDSMPWVKGIVGKGPPWG